MVRKGDEDSSKDSKSPETVPKSGSKSRSKEASKRSLFSMNNLLGMNYETVADKIFQIMFKNENGETEATSQYV